MAPQRPQNKHLKPEAGQAALGIVALASDEISKTVRVRGLQVPLEWFAGLTASQRGELVRQAYVASPAAAHAAEQYIKHEGG